MAWDAEQLANARLIMAVGREMGMSSRDILIALMSAMQESSLRNLRGGDQDSAGLFQQRPSAGWGSYSQVTNPLYAARKFFTVLRGIKSRNSMQLWQAAQAVQRSAYPQAYARWEADARRVMKAMGLNVDLPFPLNPPPGGMDPTFYTTSNPFKEPGAESALTPGVASIGSEKMVPAAPGIGPSVEQPQAPQQLGPKMDPSDLKDFPSTIGLSPAGDGVRGRIVAEGLKWLGTPYSWGGGSLSGPSYGIAQGAGTRGFDCSGLVMYLYNKFGIKMPRVVPDQARAALSQGGYRAPLDSLQPGDLVVANSGEHIMIYIGNGRVLQAPHTGDVVKVSTLNDYYRRNFYGIHLNIPGGGSGAVPDMETGMADANGSPVNLDNGTAVPVQNINEPPQGGALLNFPGLF